MRLRTDCIKRKVLPALRLGGGVLLCAGWAACGSRTYQAVPPPGASLPGGPPVSAVVEFSAHPQASSPLLAVEGLSTETEAIEFRDGSAPPTLSKKIPGRTSYSNPVLLRRFRDTSWWDWRQQVIKGMPPPRSGAIVFRQPDGRELLRWTFSGAWAAGYSLRLVDGTLVEELEMVIENSALQTKGP